MERLGLIGVNWRHADPTLLERLTLPSDGRDQQLLRIREETGVAEMLYLATCNRVEILFTARGSLPIAQYRPLFFHALLGREPRAGEAARTFRAWGGEGAVEHLLLVAAGLDSAQLGEHEIRGQLRAAHEHAVDHGLAGSRLSFVVQQAIRVAREVQQRTGLMDGRISIAEVGLDAVRERARDRPEPVALLGVSAMTERCGEELKRADVPLIVVNRTPERARELASRLGADWRGLDDFRIRPDRIAALICAAGGDQPVLDARAVRFLAESSPDALVVDFGVPSNVDRGATEAAGLEHLTMGEISRRAELNQDRRREQAVFARELVDNALVQLRHQMSQRSMAPVLSKIGTRYRQTADTGVDRLFRRELKHLNGGERDAVERFAHNLAKRLAHLPSVGLRALASEFGVGAVDTFLTAADDALAQELQQALDREDTFNLDLGENEA